VHYVHFARVLHAAGALCIMFTLLVRCMLQEHCALCSLLVRCMLQEHCALCSLCSCVACCARVYALDDASNAISTTYVLLHYLNTYSAEHVVHD